MASSQPTRWPSQTRPGKPETVPLLSATGHRHLAFHRDNDSDRIIRVVETERSGSGQPTSVERFIHLDRDAILPLYTLSDDHRAGFNMQVMYFEGKHPVTYRLSSRTDAFGFQRLTTGYSTVEHFSGVTCSVVFRGRFGVFGRDEELYGSGELQFWQPSEPDVPSTTAENRSPLDGPHSRRTGMGRSPRTSVVDPQSDFALANDGTEVVISTAPPKPTLMAFFQDHERCTMLMIDFMNLESKKLASGRVKLSPTDSRSFCADSISVSKNEMESWDVCSMTGKGPRPGVNKLKCTNLTLEFQDANMIEDFEKRLVFLKLQWGTAVRQMRSVRNGMEAGKLATSPAASPNLPRAKLDFRKPEARVGTTSYLELSADAQSHELDSLPVEGVHELPAESMVWSQYRLGGGSIGRRRLR
ncbi:hypothetical protein B0T16DRAFT_245272 [Cercophora newfieldiana]|uniref:Uncharacterized protein n=1 Tax=Cercophora newfieldiana TaxID=92897 RepID=A0AA39XSP3_9PEZI|nr:hypothetical protein B0T16DRAFT_245272 [Cercophora newfieldiana]